MTNTVISHYRVLQPLGEGGMGIVYRAEDLRLGREVAIKFLRTDEASEVEWRARFEREARLASALKHPHICTIHELGEHEGRPFIVMELLEGRTVKQVLEAGPLRTERLLEYGVQIASALEAAHERGIVHRDIKPANLLVTHEDRLKILDFGLAKVAALREVHTWAGADRARARGAMPEVTTTGATVGTAAYMSPEQAGGEPVDARTDLFSFGSVLYEMATARRAFPGDTTGEVIRRLLNGDIVPPRALNPAIPERLEAIVMRALQVDKARRYQHASEMLTDLRAFARSLSTDLSGTLPLVDDRPAAPRRRSRVATIGAAILGASLAVLAGSRWLVTSRPAALTDRDSILIAAFENNTGDAVFDDALATALRVHLGQSPFLDFVPDDRIRETLRLMGRSPDERLTHDVAREICQRLGIKAMLDGSVKTLGSNYVVTLAATDCQTGGSVAREQGEATNKDRVLGLLGSLASSMRTTLGESLPSIQKFDVPIEQATTPSLPALKAYALGVAERRRGRDLESVAFFNQAIELDPEFAAAYTTLSTVYGSLGEWRRSEDYARLAYARQKRVSERERLFITYQFHDRVTGNLDLAVQALEVWKASYPRDVQPANALALLHNRIGRYDRGVIEATEGLRRSPGHPFPMSNLAFAYRGLGRYDDARKVAGDAVRLGVATVPTRRLLYQLGEMAGDTSAAAQLAWAKDQPRQFDLVSAQAQVAAFEGRLHEASELYSQAADMALARGLSGTASGYWAHLAWTEALYGEPAAVTERVRQIVARTATTADSPGTVPRFRAAAALGLVGMQAEAREIVARAEQQYPDSTLMKGVLIPSGNAAVALGRGRPSEALTALEAAQPVEFGTVAGLVPTYLRAEAYMALHDTASAAREYQKILDHRGADPFAPVVPLAHLGLARIAARTGDVERSRQQFEILLGMWKNADADLPVLRRARADFRRLLTTPRPAAGRTP